MQTDLPRRRSELVIIQRGNITSDRFKRSNHGGFPKKAGGTSRLHPFENGPVEIVDLAKFSCFKMVMFHRFFWMLTIQLLGIPHL